MVTVVVGSDGWWLEVIVMVLMEVIVVVVGVVTMLLMTEVMAVADVMVVGDGRGTILKWLGQKQA